jgi:hypothetical protein
MQAFFPFPDSGAIVREQHVRFENVGVRRAYQWASLNCKVPEALHADTGGGVRPRAESNHGTMGPFPINAGKEYFVSRHALLGKVKAFGLVRELIHWKLPLRQHLLPGKPQKLK